MPTTPWGETPMTKTNVTELGEDTRPGGPVYDDDLGPTVRTDGKVTTHGFDKLPPVGGSKWGSRYDIEKHASGLGHVVNEIFNTVNPFHTHWNGPKDAQHYNDLLHHVAPHQGDDLANPAGEYFNEHTHVDVDAPQLGVDTAAGYGLLKFQDAIRRITKK